MYIANTYFILKKISSINKENEEERIREIVRDYIMSDQFREIISQAINDTQLTKDFQIMKLILCTRIDELKNTRICNDGNS